jgi:hypothetical protein
MSGHLKYSVGLLIAYLLISPPIQGEMRVGTGWRVITPDPLLPVSGGFGVPSPADEKRGELTARAAVFCCGDEAVAIVSLDVLGFPSVLCDRIRRQVPRIPPENILISSTHTHSAPCCYAFPDARGGHSSDLDYLDFICQQAAAALNEAIDAARPCGLRIATGEANGKIAYNYYAPDLYDRRMSVIQAVRPDGQTVLTLVNFAIHPEVLGADAGVVSPDLVGPFCEHLEKHVDGMAMFVNGAQGGMVTADNRDLENVRDPLRGYWEDIRDWNECVRIGHAMAEEARRIVRDARLQPTPTLFCRATNVRFPVESDDFWNVVVHSPLGYPHGDDRTVTVRVNLVNVGSAQIITIPGEALPNIGFYLKRKMHGEHNLLFGLTNDALGYLLTKVDFQSFPRYDYVSRVSLGEMTGELFIEEALRLIDACPRPDSSGAP